MTSGCQLATGYTETVYICIHGNDNAIFNVHLSMDRALLRGNKCDIRSDQ